MAENEEVRVMTSLGEVIINKSLRGQRVTSLCSRTHLSYTLSSRRSKRLRLRLVAMFSQVRIVGDTPEWKLQAR